MLYIDYFLQLIASKNFFLYILIMSAPSIIILAFAILMVIKLYREYKYVFNSEIDSLYITCGQFSTLLRLLDIIARGDKIGFLKIQQFNIDALLRAVENVKFLDNEIGEGIDALFRALRIDPSTLRDIRRGKQKLRLVGTILSILVLGSYILLMILLAIFGENIIELIFSGEIFHALPLLALPWIIIFIAVGISLFYDYLITRQIKKILNIELLGFSETSMLAEKIIERLLAITATRISKPIIVFLGRRYKYLKPKSIWYGIPAYILEPTGTSPPSIKDSLEIFKKRSTSHI